MSKFKLIIYLNNKIIIYFLFINININFLK